MGFYLSLPYLFFRFWYFEAPVRLFKYFGSVNRAALEILSLPLMFRTFFKPLKNEYRKGLVWFSISMGIFIKTIFIFIDLIFMIGLILFEAFVLFLFLFWPFLTILLLFY